MFEKYINATFSQPQSYFSLGKRNYHNQYHTSTHVHNYENETQLYCILINYLFGGKHHHKFSLIMLLW